MTEGGGKNPQHRDVRRMTNVVSTAITGPQINSLSKFIVHLPSASCRKACNMTPLKFVLTSTPGGVKLPPLLLLLLLLLLFANGAGGANYAKEVGAVCQRQGGDLHWGLSLLSLTCT